MILAIIAIILGKKLKKQQKNVADPLEKKLYFNAKLGFNLGVAGIIISLICFFLAFVSTIYQQIQV